MLWTFLTIFLTGLCLFIGGLVVIHKTRHGVKPAIVSIIGILVAFVLPSFIGGQEGILIDSTTQWWIDWHKIFGYIAFTVLISTLVIDWIYTYWADGSNSSTLSQLNTTYSDDDEGRALKAAHERDEKFFLPIAIVVAIISATVFHHVMSSPSHILLEVTRAAHVKGYPVQLNPFIIEMPAEKFTAATLQSLTNGAQAEGRAKGLNDFTITKVYSLRFVSRDNNVIDEVIILFDGTHLVEKKSADPQDASKVVTENEEVAFSKAIISVPRPGTEEETQAFGAKMLRIVQDKEATSGSGLSGLPPSSSPNSYAPIIIEVNPVETSD